MEDRHLCLGNGILTSTQGAIASLGVERPSLKNMNKTISQCQATVAQACDALQASDAFHQDCGPGPLLHASSCNSVIAMDKVLGDSKCAAGNAPVRHCIMVKIAMN